MRSAPHWMQNQLGSSCPMEWSDVREESDGSIMEEPIMPRLARLSPIPFGWYYVALHSVTNRRIVTSHAELATLLELLRVTLREKGARLHAGYVAAREAHLALPVG